MPCIRQMTATLLLPALATLLFTACAALHPPAAALPPVLAQDEATKPFAKLGTIEVTRRVLGTVELPHQLAGRLQQPSDANYAWGLQALREEAAKLHADAVILPEITGETSQFYLFFIPYTNFRAKGIAIRFR